MTNQEKFDKIAKELGWIKPYDEVPLWYHKINAKKGLEVSNYYITKFSINSEYENLNNYPHLFDKIDENYVRGCMKYFSGNSSLEENLIWVVPMNAADYWSHKGFGKLEEYRTIAFEQELKYAKLAMNINPKITPGQFSPSIREKLAEHEQNKSNNIS